MSILKMSQVWALKNLEPNEKLLLLALADFADDDGSAWPSIHTLAEKSSMSVPTVRRKLKSAVKAGLLTITPRKDKSGRDTSSKFQLFPDMLVKVSNGEAVTVTASHRDTPPYHRDRGEGLTVIASFMKHQYEPSKERESPRVLFDQFYASYPKRKNRAAAEKAFNKLNPSAQLFTQMMDALAWQVKQPEWLKNGGQFIPLPASWLNARRWEDERPATVSAIHATPREGNSLESLRAKGIDI